MTGRRMNGDEMFTAVPRVTSRSDRAGPRRRAGRRTAASGFASTFVPGASRNCPSTTTVSPPLNPDAMTASPSSSNATVTGRSSAFFSAVTT